LFKLIFQYNTVPHNFQTLQVETVGVKELFKEALLFMELVL